MGSEHAMIRLDRPVPGLDHLKAVDSTKLCDVLYSADVDAGGLGIDSPKEFGVWQGARPCWWPASAGLKLVRDLIAHYESRIAGGADSIGGTKHFALPERLSILKQVEGVLEKADTYDRRFHFAFKV